MAAALEDATPAYPGKLKGPCFHFFPRPGSRQLVIYFSGTGKKNGKFDFWNVGRTIEANLLFVNDDRNHWYQYGVRGLGSSVKATVAMIDKWRKALDIEETFTVGASMGGYGAVLYGCLLRAKVVGFGFDTLLRLPTSPSQTHMPKDVRLVYPDLRPVIAKTGTPVHVYLGEMFTVDVFGALRLTELPTVKIETLRGVGHSCARYIHEKVNLQSVFSALITGEPFPRLWETGTICTQPKLVALLYKAHVAAKNNDWAECALRCRAALKFNRNDEAVNFLLGQAYLKLNRPHLAVTHLSVVVASLPDFEDGSFSFASAAKACKQFNRALLLFRRHVEKWPDSAKANYNLAMIYEVLGQNEEAIACMRQAIRDPSWNAVYSHKLAQMLDRMAQRVPENAVRKPTLMAPIAKPIQMLFAAAPTQVATSPKPAQAVSTQEPRHAGSTPGLAQKQAMDKPALSKTRLNWIRRLLPRSLRNSIG